jgi:two-component sensor histidine kinase
MFTHLTGDGAPRASGDPWLFLTEIEHRVANEYALAAASVSLAAARSTNLDVKATLGLTAQRLRDYAQVHHVLRAPTLEFEVDLADRLRDLCLALSRASLEERGISLTLAETRLQVGAQRAWRVGLIVFELVINSVRHGLGGRPGAIRVELGVSRGCIHCVVADDGHGAQEWRPGLGARLVDALAGELGGFVQRDFRSNGARVMLTFPRFPEPTTPRPAPAATRGASLS